MTRKHIGRLAVAAASTIVCLALAWWGGLGERMRPSSRAGSPFPPRVLAQARFSEEALRELHPTVVDLLVLDPVAHVLRRPSSSRIVPWKEHEDGEFTIATNELSFREDGPTPARTDATRVIVIGDSHTDGMVNNSESFPNLLEALLEEHGGAGPWDVVNAGVPGVGPLEQLGQLRRCLELHPRLVVMVLFTGNDFQGALTSVHRIRGRSGPISSERSRFVRPVREIRRRWPQIAQGLHQVYDFKVRPDQFEVALAATVQCYEVMARLCRERSVELLVVALPTKYEVDEDDVSGYVKTMLRELELSPEDCAVNRRLSEAFLERVERDLEVPTLDLYEPMRSATSALFWNQDHHLNVRGHELVARALARPVLEILARGE